jgi:hypothetical protein
MVETVVNIIIYLVFKKLQMDDNDLLKTNMVLKWFKGGVRIGAKGMIDLELTVESKILPTAFFGADVAWMENGYLSMILENKTCLTHVVPLVL